MHHHAAFLAILSAIATISTVTAAGWWLMRGQHTTASQLWFAGMAAYVASTLVFLGHLAAGHRLQPVGLAPVLALVALLLQVESLRREAGRQPATLAKAAIALATVVAAEWALSSATGNPMHGAALRLAAVTALDLYMIGLLLELSRRGPSKGLAIIGLGLVWLATANALRATSAIVDGRILSVLDLTPTGDFLFLGLFVGVATIALGYWGYAVEKSNLERLKAREEAARAQEAQRISEAFNAQLQEMIQQRDQLIMAISRFRSLGNLPAFNAGIVHELSQPLQGLLSCIEGLQLDAQQAGQADLAGKLRKAQAMAMETAGTLQTLRRLTLPTPASTELVPVKELLEGVLPVIESEARQRGVDFRLHMALPEPQVQVHAQRALFDRVLLNLAANALEALEQANGQPRAIEVWCSLAPLEVGRRPAVLVTVVDNGPGLGASAREDVPDMPSSSKPDGMGVGLMWTRALLRRWGGDFSLADRPEGEGPGVRAECRLALAPSWVLGAGSIEPVPDDGPL